MDTSHYCHLGLKNVIKKIVTNRIQRLHDFSTVNLFINIDGAPITGTSSEKDYGRFCARITTAKLFTLLVFITVQRNQKIQMFF